MEQLPTNAELLAYGDGNTQRFSVSKSIGRDTVDSLVKLKVIRVRCQGSPADLPKAEASAWNPETRSGRPEV